MYHFTISPYKFVYNYKISLNKYSRHLTHHLHQYYIFTDRISNYSESYESHVDRSTTEYAKAEKKYDTYLHITPDSLDNFPNNNSSRTNFYASSKIFQRFDGCKSAIRENYCAAGRFFVHAFNHGYAVSFRKRLERPQSCMR